MDILIWDQNTDRIDLVPKGAQIPVGDFIYGRLSMENGYPQVVLDLDNYDMPANMDHFSELMEEQHGISLDPSEILSDASIKQSKLVKKSDKITEFQHPDGEYFLHETKYNGKPSLILYDSYNLPILVAPIGQKLKLISGLKNHLGINEIIELLEDKSGEEYQRDLTNIQERRKNRGEWTLKQSNVLDPIHETLDQDVFNGIEPDLSLFKAHLHHIKKVFRQYDYNPADFDFYLTGSLCTYQYHKNSDVDISITSTPGYLSDEDRAFLVSIIVNELDGEYFPGTKHPFQHYLQPEGVDIYDLFSIGVRAGYDFRDDRWLIKPDRMKAVDIKKEHPDWISEAILVSDKINTLLDEGYDDEALTVYKDIHYRRRQDELVSGDVSEGNVIYKFLDNNGTFNRLRKIGIKIASSENNLQSLLINLNELFGLYESRNLEKVKFSLEMVKHFWRKLYYNSLETSNLQDIATDIIDLNETLSSQIGYPELIGDDPNRVPYLIDEIYQKVQSLDLASLNKKSSWKISGITTDYIAKIKEISNLIQENNFARALNEANNLYESGFYDPESDYRLPEQIYGLLDTVRSGRPPYGEKLSILVYLQRLEKSLEEKELYQSTTAPPWKTKMPDFSQVRMGSFEKSSWHLPGYHPSILFPNPQTGDLDMHVGSREEAGHYGAIRELNRERQYGMGEGAIDKAFDNTMWRGLYHPDTHHLLHLAEPGQWSKWREGGGLEGATPEQVNEVFHPGQLNAWRAAAERSGYPVQKAQFLTFPNTKASEEGWAFPETGEEYVVDPSTLERPQGAKGWYHRIPKAPGWYDPEEAEIDPRIKQEERQWKWKQEHPEYAKYTNWKLASSDQEYLDSLVNSNDPSQEIRDIVHDNLLEEMIPELDQTFGFNLHKSNQHHDLGEHLLDVLDGVSKLTKDTDTRIAALLHDIAKPEVQKENKHGEFKYPNHPAMGAEMARHILERLEYPSDRIERIAALIWNHKFHDFKDSKSAKIFLDSLGGDVDLANEQLNLRIADREDKVDPGDAERIVARMRKLVNGLNKTSSKPLWYIEEELIGNDIDGFNEGEHDQEPDLSKENDIRHRKLDSTNWRIDPVIANWKIAYDTSPNIVLEDLQAMEPEPNQSPIDVNDWRDEGEPKGNGQMDINEPSPDPAWVNQINYRDPIESPSYDNYVGKQPLR